VSASGLWPREAPRPTRSEAERRVYAALRDNLPKGWHAWHSLRICDRANIDGEGDFVIAAPDRGLLALEVKGGQVEVRDGRWLQNGHAMKKPPRDQGLAFVNRLVGRLRDEQCAPPAYGVATCFPDVQFDRDPTQGDVEGRALGAQDLPWLAKALPELMERALPPARPPRGRWIDRLHALWGETWTPRIRLGRRARMDDEARIELDAKQIEILEYIQHNDRVLVDGGAGTGKTILACEVARRWAADGKRVLLLCFTKALGQWVGTALEGSGVHVDNVRGLARDLMVEAKLPLNEGTDGFWEELPWRAASEALPVLGSKWDAIVVDEGQDFTLGDWTLVEQCAGDGPLWAFHDAAQAFWEDREVPADLFAVRFHLPRNYRCPPHLRLVAEAYAGKPLDEVALREALARGELAVIPCPSESSVPDKVATEIDKLLSEGLQPQDIAVISLRGQSAEGSIFQREKLGRHRLVHADDPDMESHVVADTFLRFKGLERPAIIATDLRLVRDKRDVRMHIALTRALLTARVVAPRDVIEASPVLGRV